MIIVFVNRTKEFGKNKNHVFGAFSITHRIGLNKQRSTKYA